MDFDQNTYKSSSKPMTFRDYLTRVYSTVAVGVAISGVIAFFLGRNVYVLYSLMGDALFMFVLGACVLELAVGLFFSLKISSMSKNTAWICYIFYAGQVCIAFLGIILYSVLTGVSLSSLISVYTDASVFMAFFATAVMFICMVIIGHTTRIDLSSISGLLFAGLIGILITGVVNIFLRSSMIDYVITVVGVLVFLGLTAYDMQKLRVFYENSQYDDELSEKAMVYGAFQLYLDFINLFIRILQLFGKRDD